MNAKLPIPSRDSIPLLKRIETPVTKDRILPVAIGVGLLAVGAVLWRMKPGALAIPAADPLHEDRGASRWRRAARRSRNGVAKVAPENLSDSLGRSLVFAGGALLVTRLLDEITAYR
ncbi:hypothetical protein [Pseudooceanicola sp.]|uniref:hypothetical protein n=1 Tax=Pseudooceanicola sp. TaxID=1914328 RepID=UPI0040588B6A